jgi:RNA polymerase-binding transcription factor
MAATKKPATKQTATAKKAVAKKLPAKKEPAQKVPAKKAAGAKKPADKVVAKKSPATNSHSAHETTELPGIPAPRGKTKDGIAYTKDFDVKFLKTQHGLLIAERDTLLGQASRLEDEANSLIEDGEMGDVQFDDESGEGDTMVVERERDLALSATARQTVDEIERALARMADGSYGYCVTCGDRIPVARLEVIPWADQCVKCKSRGERRR